MQFNVTA